VGKTSHIVGGKWYNEIMRKDLLVTGEVYHIYTKSIAGFKIFSNNSDYLRMFNVIRYYKREKTAMKFSDFIRIAQYKKEKWLDTFIESHSGNKLVEIVAYCIMPTHLHLILKQTEENGISTFMRYILNSYARYFNVKYKRKGPLWEGRFKNLLVKADEQLLHLTRYIHLNPVTAYLVDKPEEWIASSYREYLSDVDNKDKICEYSDLLEAGGVSYKDFVEDQISYQRELAQIKEVLFKEPDFPHRKWEKLPTS